MRILTPEQPGRFDLSRALETLPCELPYPVWRFANAFFRTLFPEQLGAVVADRKLSSARSPSWQENFNPLTFTGAPFLSPLGL